MDEHAEIVGRRLVKNGDFLMCRVFIELLWGSAYPERNNDYTPTISNRAPHISHTEKSKA